MERTEGHWEISEDIEDRICELRKWHLPQSAIRHWYPLAGLIFSPVALRWYFLPPLRDHVRKCIVCIMQERTDGRHLRISRHESRYFPENYIKSCYLTRNYIYVKLCCSFSRRNLKEWVFLEYSYINLIKLKGLLVIL